MNLTPAKGCTVQERWITDWPVSERWPHYTRANAGEVLPDPASPLGQQFSWEKGMALFCKAFTTAKVKCFDVSALDEAKRWVREAT